MSRQEQNVHEGTSKSPETVRSKLLIVDDHPVVREGLAARIDREPDLVVCGTAADPIEALAAIEERKPDLVVADLSLAGKPGLELVKNLERKHPELPVLVLSIHDETLWAERVLRAGARGYIMKSQVTEKIIEAIRSILDGGIWVSEKVSARLLKSLAARAPARSSDSPLEKLTDRELEVFHLIGQGLGVREIAANLFLSVKTVEVHRDHVREKLGLKSSAALVRYAVTYLLEEK
jgi:DNA-binding NarL/FixJ family response regulator